MAELVIDGATENLGVAVFEVIVELTECSNLSGADEGEVLRVEEHDEPLTGVRGVGDGLEVVFGLGSLNVVEVAALECGESELWELIADG